MRIAFFTDTYLPDRDGIVYSIESFRNSLMDFGHEVFVLAPRPIASAGSHLASENVFMLPSIPTPFDNRRAGFAVGPAIRRVIAELDVDLIHVHYLSTVGILGFYAAIKDELPLVCTWHVDLYGYVEHYPRLLPYLLGLSCLSLIQVPLSSSKRQVASSVLTPRKNKLEWSREIVSTMSTALHNSCDTVIAPSVKARDQLVSWGTTSPVQILPTGVDQPVLEPRAVESVRRIYDLEYDYPIILYVGRLAPEKNVDLLIKAIGLVLPTYPTARLILVGDHKLCAHTVKLATDLGVAARVVFTGWLDRRDLGAIYAAATLFVFPSLTDTQGIVLHEAALSGLPIIVVDGHLNDIVKDGISGVRADSTPRSVAKSILRLAGDPAARARLARAARDIAGNFSVEKQARRLEEIYANVVGAR